MPATNMISAAINTADKTAILEAITTIKSKLPFLINLSDGARAKMRTAATKRAGYINDVVEAVTAFPDALPSSFDIAEFLTDGRLNKDLGEIKAAVADLGEKLEDTLLQIRSELMAQSDAAYGYLKTGAKSNGSLKTAVEKIGTAFKRQGKPSALKVKG